MAFYKLSYLLGFIAMLLINLKTKKLYKLKTSEAVVITLVTYICGVIGAVLMGNINGLVLTMNNLPASSGVAISGAVMFTPLFMLIFALIAKKDWKIVLDLITPGVYAILACAKMGCATAGCCAGIEWESGVYNESIGANVLPIQPIEATVMFIIVATVLIYIYKAKNCIPGTIYPITSMIYTFFRFFVEFFRYYEYEEQRHIIFGMTLWQFCCVLMFTISLIWVLVLKNKHKKLSE